VKYFVAKLVKSFGRIGDATESLDDFRYTEPVFRIKEILHGVSPLGPGETTPCYGSMQKRTTMITSNVVVDNAAPSGEQDEFNQYSASHSVAQEH
jgi:hypothetical protein